MQKVYIETSISSFYYEIRTEAEFVAMRNWTRLWWKESRKELDAILLRQ